MKRFTLLTSFSLLFLFQISIIFADTDNPPRTFFAIPFTEGVPNITPIKSIPLHDVRHAFIDLQSLTRSVIVVWGKTDEGQDRFWLAGYDGKGNVITQSRSMELGENGVFRSSFDLKGLDPKIAPTPLEIQVIPDHRLLLYRGPNTALPFTLKNGSSDQDQNGELLKVGGEFPDFTVELLNTSLLSTSDLKDQIVVINWWATTCAPCIEEMPGLNQLVEKYKDNRNIVFLAIAADKREDLLRFLGRRRFAYTQALYNKSVSEVFGNRLPRNVIVNAEGTIVYDDIGGSPDKFKELDGVITKLRTQ